MRASDTLIRHRSILVLGALLALGACKSDAPEPTAGPAQPVTIAQEATATAEVVGVDKATRVVTLSRDDGTLLRIKAGEAVRNFDQIAVGDHLRIRYGQKLTAVRNPALTSAQPGQLALASARAPEGGQPGAGAAAHMHVAVKVESVDTAHNLVAFSLASGELIAHRVTTPEGRMFLGTLKAGDIVELDYAEALALTMERM